MAVSPFLNPLFLTRVLKSYLSDVNRVWHTSLKDLRKYQNTMFRKMVQYAYTIPLYHEKYKQAGVHPRDIHGISDIDKLPLISKDDLRSYYPEGILPKGSTQQGFLLSTSGSTGKPVFFYCDHFSAIKRLEGFVRTLRAYGGDWRKSKTALIIDLAPGSVEHATYQESTIPVLQHFLTLENIKYISLDEKPEEILRQLNHFQPEFLGSDPNMLQKLAVLKNKGKGAHVKPQVLFAGGSMLDSYTKQYVEQAFGTRLYDVYGSTEAGPMAFECVEGGYYHVQSDFVYMECMDEQNNPVSHGKPGHLVITRLYGKGTPIIRYTGIEDIIVPVEQETHCGITTEMLSRIEGRSADMLVLPNGQLLSPLTITGIPAKVMQQYNSYKIDQFQIIQHAADDIEIVVVINEMRRHQGIPVVSLIKELHNHFQLQLGNDISIRVHEVPHIQPETRSDYVKVVISHVNTPSKKG